MSTTQRRLSLTHNIFQSCHHTVHRTYNAYPKHPPPNLGRHRGPFHPVIWKNGHGQRSRCQPVPLPPLPLARRPNESPPTPITIQSKGKHVEPFRTPCVECGVSLKVSKTPSLSSIVQFEYAFNKSGSLYHDISLTKCASGNDASACSGHVHGLKVEGHGMQDCQTLECAANAYCPADACYVPMPGAYQPAKTCGQD